MHSTGPPSLIILACGIRIGWGLGSGSPGGALAVRPYDEPSTMVDPIMSDHLSDLMRRLKKQLGPTSIVVKPDRPHVREFLEMDRVA